jgi:hypothetical protein
LPASVRGPVECWELARLVAAREVGCRGLGLGIGVGSGSVI